MMRHISYSTLFLFIFSMSKLGTCCHLRIAIYLLFAVVAMLSSCSDDTKQAVDRLNYISYSQHYRNLDSTECYARQALKHSGGYDDGQAEAYNNLAFVSMSRMNYATAMQQLDSVNVSDNQIELLVADVQKMRLCQRKSLNKDFYIHNERAVRRMRRIDEEYNTLDQRSRKRMAYAQSEYYITLSTYYYYVGLERPSVAAISNIDEQGEIQQDTAQYLNYLYNVGAGGVISVGAQDSILQAEMDYLVKCYYIALYGGYAYWQANALQAISEHLMQTHYGNTLLKNNPIAINAINIDNMPDSLMAGNFAQRALNLFNQYGDVYQTAGAYRTLAQCYEQIGDYQSSLICLHDALKTKDITQAPELVASIREQLSVVYSALNDKPQSDYNRNRYLDLQEQTRQDRYFESRAELLDTSVMQLNLMIGAVVVVILAVVILLLLFNRMKKRGENTESLAHLLNPLQQWKEENERKMQALSEQYEDVNEQIAVVRREIDNNLLRNVEQRAKVSLAMSITPLIDRMLHEINRMEKDCEPTEEHESRYAYMVELIDRINESNTMLTEWIQLRPGKLSLRIESFPVKWLFDIVGKSTTAFRMKGIRLEIETSDEVVKADKILSLFMLNTLIDNARKFTPVGGCVTVTSHAEEDYVEIGVSDTGCGMTAEQCASVFDRKAIVNKNDADCLNVHSHGFGLMNCKGIIERYKKISGLFRVCDIGVESIKGKGSRFFFRLPKGVCRLLAGVVLMLGTTAQAQDMTFELQADSELNVAPATQRVSVKLDAKQQQQFNVLQNKASAYSDSAYHANINARYADCVLFADSCRQYLNAAYHVIMPTGTDLMERMANRSHIPAEIIWLHQGLPIDFGTILEIRNETAVAALALHDMELYIYNNKVYTQLFKEQSADNSLGEYCYRMKRSENNKGVAVVLLVILLLLIFPAYYVLYFRHRLYFRFCVERVKTINDILVSGKSDEEKLALIAPIDISRYPEALQDIVKQLKEALRISISGQQKGQAEVEMAQDELHRERYENARLHIDNNVLDNCMSTLKHETMYYPSQIRQLITTHETALEEVEELAHYYKDLHSMLVIQAIRQTESHPVPCTNVPVQDLLPPDTEVEGNAQVRVMGNATLLRELFTLLRKQGDNTPMHIVVDNNSAGYVRLEVGLPSLHLDADACQSVFNPHRENIPFFICRQIARDNGETTNRRACGIIPHLASDGSTSFTVTLAAAQRNNHMSD